MSGREEFKNKLDAVVNAAMGYSMAIETTGDGVLGIVKGELDAAFDCVLALFDARGEDEYTKAAVAFAQAHRLHRSGQMEPTEVPRGTYRREEQEAYVAFERACDGVAKAARAAREKARGGES